MARAHFIRSDFTSDQWSAVAAYAQGRVDALRAELENLSMNPESTAIVRGRLSELRKLLALPETAAPAKRATSLSGDVAQFDPASGHDDE